MVRQNNSLSRLWEPLFTSLIASSAHAQSNHVEIEHPSGDFVIISGVMLRYETEGSGKPLTPSGASGMSHSHFHPYFSVIREFLRK
jgi:hypothetical protein